MKPLGLSDVVGPIMVGPSSSHTAGALRIAKMARNLLADEPVRADFTLYGSFSHTYKGHGTDLALVAGMLGMSTSDPWVRDSFEIAHGKGLEFSFAVDSETKVDHPNTVDVRVEDRAGNKVSVRGVSIGGGAAELTSIDGVSVKITGEYTNLIIRQKDAPGMLAFVSGLLAQANVNIASVSLHRTRRGGEAIVVMDVDGSIQSGVTDVVAAHPSVLSVRVVPAEGSRHRVEGDDPVMGIEEAVGLFSQVDFASAEQMVAYCDQEGVSLGAAFRRREEVLLAMQGRGSACIDRYLDKVVEVMAESVNPTGRPTMGGLIGGEASAMLKRERAVRDGAPGLGWAVTRLAARAMAVLETNASMGRIVAAPTAGSSGVLPAVLLTLREMLGSSDDQVKDALLNAAAVGQLIARNATVSGAEGGCQAEVGAASAMAASVAAQLMGGDPRTCFAAASVALANMLGLVCDPVGGLVEAPCQKRNASAAANALVSAEIALAGVRADAPFDEVVDAMAKVGRSLPYELRETALGGMAACPSCKACVLR